MKAGYLDSVAAAAYAGYCNADGTVTPAHVKRFYDWASRGGVKKFHAGRRLRFKAEDIDAAMDGRDVLLERALHIASGGQR